MFLANRWTLILVLYGFEITSIFIRGIMCSCFFWGNSVNGTGETGHFLSLFPLFYLIFVKDFLYTLWLFHFFLIIFDGFDKFFSLQTLWIIVLQIRFHIILLCGIFNTFKYNYREWNQVADLLAPLLFLVLDEAFFFVLDHE